MSELQIIHPRMISKRVAAHRVGKTPSGLDKYLKSRPDFPRPIKDGPHRQSPVYFFEQDITQWIESLAANGLIAKEEEQ